MTQNSTNVRPNFVAPAPLRAAFRVLAATSPRTAAAAGAALFFRTPPRRPTSAAERAVLDAGRRLDLGSGRSRLAAWSWGEGRSVVLLAHGWGGSAAQLTPFVAPLVAAGFAVVALDGPGHGESAGRSASIPAFAEAMARVADAHGPLDGVVAHSMGGAAFSLAAARGVGARRAVFLGPPSDAAAWYGEFVRFLQLPSRAEPALHARIELVAGEPIGRLNSRTLGPALRMPLLVIHDRHDREVPLADGARVAADATDGRLHVTEGLGHRRILRDAEVLGRAVEFLAAGTRERGGAEALRQAG